jgi:hypothetical protein
VRLGIGLELLDDPDDHGGFLGRTAEDRRLGVLEVEVVQDRHRLEDHIVVVLEHRQTTTRVHRQHLRRLLFLQRHLQKVTVVGQPLVLEGEQRSPRVRTATAPPEIDSHAKDCNGNAQAGEL